MARQPRSKAGHGTHYTALRANDTRKLFRNQEHYRQFESLVRGASQDLNARVHAFCWMQREAHFILETASSDVLKKLMHRIASMHARYINDRLGKRGPVFEQRYHSVLIECKDDFAEVIRYIHMAPVRLKLVHSAAMYPWTSHHAYLNPDRFTWISTDRVRSLFEHSEVPWLDGYRWFMASERHALRDVAASVRGEPIAKYSGSQWILSRLSPQRRPTFNKALLEHIVQLVAAELGVSPEELPLPSRQRRLAAARALAAWYAIQSKAATLSEVAAYFNRKPCTLSELLRDHERRPRDSFEIDGRVFFPRAISLGDDALGG